MGPSGYCLTPMVFSVVANLVSPEKSAARLLRLVGWAMLLVKSARSWVRQARLGREPSTSCWITLAAVAPLFMRLTMSWLCWASTWVRTSVLVRAWLKAGPLADRVSKNGGALFSRVWNWAWFALSSWASWAPDEIRLWMSSPRPLRATPSSWKKVLRLPVGMAAKSRLAVSTTFPTSGGVEPAAVGRIAPSRTNVALGGLPAGGTRSTACSPRGLARTTWACTLLAMCWPGWMAIVTLTRSPASCTDFTAPTTRPLLVT